MAGVVRESWDYAMLHPSLRAGLHAPPAVSHRLVDAQQPSDEVVGHARHDGGVNASLVIPAKAGIQRGWFRGDAPGFPLSRE